MATRTAGFHLVSPSCVHSSRQHSDPVRFECSDEGEWTFVGDAQRSRADIECLKALKVQPRRCMLGS